MPPLTSFITKLAFVLLRHHRLLFMLPVFFLCVIAFHIYQDRIKTPHVRLDAPFYIGCQNTSHFESQPRENATILMLARNSDLEGAVSSIISLEESFNSWAKYPITFLNEEPWDVAFMDAVREVASGDVQFGVIDQEIWTFPPHISPTAAHNAMTAQGAASILYGNLTSYHHMCRFNSGPFALHPLLHPYTYYWRLEPSVTFTCRLTYDPFTAMRLARKQYGYIMALWEIPATAPSLFRAVAAFKAQHRIPSSPLWQAFASTPWWVRLVPPGPLRAWAVRGRPGYSDAGERWSWCHFWSNFEIGSLDFFRSESYQALFAHLDQQGGFYFERWGDAPVHSLAAALLLRPEEVHHFADLGYKHAPYQYCPYEVWGGGGRVPDLSKVPESEARGLGCECVCDDTTVVRPVCLNRIKETVL